jgi:hypothetical protein
VARGFIRTGGVAVATDRQVAANGRNAGASTGPKTADGKEASKMNALRHGGFARPCAITVGPFREDQEVIDAELNAIVEALRPRDRIESRQARSVAEQYLALDRHAAYEVALVQETALAADKAERFRSRSFSGVDEYDACVELAERWGEVLAGADDDPVPDWLTEPATDELLLWIATIVAGGDLSKLPIEEHERNKDFTPRECRAQLRKTGDVLCGSRADAIRWARYQAIENARARAERLVELRANLVHATVRNWDDRLGAVGDRLRRQLSASYRLYEALRARTADDEDGATDET